MIAHAARLINRYDVAEEGKTDHREDNDKQVSKEWKVATPEMSFSDMKIPLARSQTTQFKVSEPVSKGKEVAAQSCRGGGPLE